MQLFYHPNIDENTKSISFDKEESRHIVRVLRKKLGNKLHITDGRGGYYVSSITMADQKKCIAEIETYELQAKPKYNLHLAVAPTKNIDRFEWFLEKATEIGVTTITPILCDNSERRVIKKERLERIIQSAMKQSLNTYLPELRDLTSIAEIFNTANKVHKLIAHCEETDKKFLFSEIEQGQDYLILIGPEGDFSTKEIKEALAHHFIPVSLGETRLRTETAAITACHTVALKNLL
ncbi:MAG: 16S rRNA (uracil(1498)-N(3))-methyltransferase [bacterium]